MKNLVVYSLLILSVAACMCSADDGEETGRLQKTLGEIGKVADGGVSGIGKAVDKGAAAINKAADKTAAKVNEIRTPMEHEHGKGKLLPSAYSGTRDLVGNLSGEVGNVAKAVFSGVRNAGKAIRDSAKHSVKRLLSSRFRSSANKN